MPPLLNTSLIWTDNFRLGNEAVPSCSKIFVHLLSSIWFVCGCLLGRVPHSSRSCSREDGDAYHPLPCAHQHLQHCHHQLSQCGGDDCHRSELQRRSSEIFTLNGLPSPSRKDSSYWNQISYACQCSDLCWSVMTIDLALTYISHLVSMPLQKKDS